MKVREIFENAPIKNSAGIYEGSVGDLLKITGSYGDLYLAKHSDIPCCVTSFEGSPNRLDHSLSIDGHKITNLNGMPSYIGGNLFTTSGSLSTFEGANHVEVNGKASFAFNKFTSLHNIHKHFSSVEELNFNQNKITSCILGLLKIKKLKKVYFFRKDLNLETNKTPLAQANVIINKYLPEGDILACQQELIDAGLEEYAKL